MSGNEMFGVFFQDNQISGMSHSVDPSLSLTSFDMQSPCLQPKLGFICLNESPIGIIREFFRFTITGCSGMWDHTLRNLCLCIMWMRPAAINPTVSTLVFPYWSLLSSHRWLKPKSLSPQSAKGSLGYQLSSIAWERHCSRAWYISKGQYSLRGWLQFSKHLAWNMGRHIKVWCCKLACNFL